jgi:ABC-type lipoprotein release transport system permease subunit
MGAISAAKGVGTVTPRIDTQGLMSYGQNWENMTAAFVIGVDVWGEENVTRLYDYIVGGSRAEFQKKTISGYYTALVGERFLEKNALSVYTGDGQPNQACMVKVTLGRYRETNGVFDPIVMDFVIVGAFDTQVPLFNERTVIMPLESARQLLDYSVFNPKATDVLVKLRTGAELEEVKQDIEEMKPSNQTLDVRTYKDVSEEYLAPVYSIVQPIVFLIVGVSMTATFSIIAYSASVSMRERKRDVGLLMAMGVRNRAIMGYYLTEHAIIGFFGGVAGLVFSSIIAFFIKQGEVMIYTLKLYEMRLYPTPFLMLVIPLLSLSITVLASFYVIYKTASLEPAEAVRSL